MNRSAVRRVVLALLLILLVFYLTPLSRRLRGPDAIVIHESASRWGNAASIRNGHMLKGWSDIGYHAVILNGRLSRRSGYDPHLDGKIEPGRPDDVRGAHCEAEDMNSHSLGVCLIGDPRYPGYPTKKQMDALVHYCAVKCTRYRIPLSNITQHSDHEPEKPLDASLDLPALRKRVQKEMMERE